MKKFLSAFLIICTLLCGNVFAEDDYTVIDMSEFAQIGDFLDGVCAVQDKNTSRWGFVDVNKNWVIAPKFQSASYFRNGLCAVNTVDSETVLINHNGDVVFKAYNYYNNVDSGNNFFVDKHGKYLTLWEGRSEWSTYSIKLFDENFNARTVENINLSTFKVSSIKSPYVSHTFFWNGNDGKVYNYKGVDISDKLMKENLVLSNDMIANNKYIIGYSDEKIKCFDVDGNKVAEFADNNDVILRDDVIVCNSRVYNIAENNMVFDGQDINVQEIVPYYNKYFTVKKKKGTSALYSKDGELLSDFGKWDTVIPLSTSKHIIVSANDKYGLADYDGNIIFALDNLNGYAVSNGKYAEFVKKFERNVDIYVLIDPITLKQYSSTRIQTGYKYNRIENSIYDNNFNVAYSNDTMSLAGGNLDNGIIKQVYSTKPVTYGFIIFKDGGVKVEIDKTELAFDVLPIIQNGRTLVPMRAIFEALGADVEWNGDTQTITAKNNDVTIQMQIGNNTLTKNGQSTQMDVSPQIIDGRTMVPVRAISDSFNVTVDWDGYTQTVSLFTN